MPVAAVPHIHAFEKHFRLLFKFRRNLVSILQFVQDGACEELELRFL